jgi:hypothetical protein
MRLVIVHDSSGNISSVAASPTGGAVMRLVGAADDQVVEVEHPDSAYEGDSDMVALLADVSESHRVDLDAAEPRLVRKA